MKEHKMTEWDAGQALVKAADELSEIMCDLKEGGFETSALVVKRAMRLIGDEFNIKHCGKSHTFGLPGNEIHTGSQPAEKK